MIKIEVKTIKEHEKSSDIVLSHKEKKETLGEYMTILNYVVNQLNEVMCKERLMEIIESMVVE